jgi:hypothetical protein
MTMPHEAPEHAGVQVFVVDLPWLQELRCFRNFNGAGPYHLQASNALFADEDFDLALTLDFAGRLARAGRYIRNRFTLAREKKQELKLGSALLKNPSPADVLDIGVDNETAIFFKFFDFRLKLEGADAVALLDALDQLGADVPVARPRPRESVMQLMHPALSAWRE